MNFANATRLLLSIALAAGNATAAERQVDCDGARAVPAGSSFTAYRKVLGKPETTMLSSGVLSYRWGYPREDFVQLTPSPSIDLRNRKAPALLLSGRCGAQKFATAFSTTYPLNTLDRRLNALGTSFHLAYLADAAEDRMRFVEYIPAGETLLDWNQMISVHLHSDGHSMEQQLWDRWVAAISQDRDIYRKVSLAADESDMVTTQVGEMGGRLEYTVVRSRKVPQGVMAMMYGIRRDAAAEQSEASFISEQDARLDDVIAMLKALPDVVPPELYRRSAIWLTLGGDDGSPVLVEPE